VSEGAKKIAVKKKLRPLSPKELQEEVKVRARPMEQEKDEKKLPSPERSPTLGPEVKPKIEKEPVETIERFKRLPLRPEIKLKVQIRPPRYAVRPPKVALPDVRKLEYPKNKILELLWFFGARGINKLRENAELLGIESIDEHLSSLKREGYVAISRDVVSLTNKGVIACCCLKKPPPELRESADKRLPVPRLDMEEGCKIELMSLDTQKFKLTKKPLSAFNVPCISVEDNVSLLAVEVDSSKLQIKPRLPLQLFAPRLVYEESAQIRLVKMDSEPLEVKEVREAKEAEEERVKAIQIIEEYSVEEGAPSEDEEVPLFPESFIELLPRSTIGGLARVRPERPVYVVVDKRSNLHELIVQLCALLLRIRLYGLPSVWSAGHSTEWWEIKRHERLLVREDIASRIINFTSPAKKYKSPLSEIQDIDILDWMRELHAEGALRFIVIPVESKHLETVAEALAVRKRPLGQYVSELLVYRGKWSEHASRWMQAAYGFPLAPEDIVDYGSAPALVDEMYKRLNRIVEILKSKISGKYCPVPGKELGQEESWMHYALKWLVLQHLVSRGLAKAEEIEFEKDDLNEKIIPDVYVENRKLAVEIETFYGVGDPWAELNEKLRRYEKLNYKLWIVVPNTQAFLFAREILKLRKDYREEELEVEVFTLDLTGYGHKLVYGKKSKPGLIELPKVIKRLRKEI